MLAELVAARDDASLAEYAGGLAERTGVRHSLAAVCRALKTLGLVRKKRRSGRPSRAAPMSPSSGRRGTPLAGIAPEQLVFIDETGIDTRMTRAYGRAARGKRVPGKVPWGHWRRLTVIGALSVDGVVASMTPPRPRAP